MDYRTLSRQPSTRNTISTQQPVRNAGLPPHPPQSASTSSSHPADIFGNMVKEIAAKKAVVIFTKSTCCMCHSIKVLFVDMGVNVHEHELDLHEFGQELEWALKNMGCSPTVPAVFIGGKLVGAATEVINLQLSGDLKQMLKDAKAIWL